MYKFLNTSTAPVIITHILRSGIFWSIVTITHFAVRILFRQQQDFFSGIIYIYEQYILTASTTTQGSSFGLWAKTLRGQIEKKQEKGLERDNSISEFTNGLFRSKQHQLGFIRVRQTLQWLPKVFYDRTRAKDKNFYM